MKIKDEYIKIQVADEWIVAVVGEESRKNKIMLELNDTAAVIWDLLKEEMTVDEIAAKLTAEYDITEECATESVTSVIKTLYDAGVME